MFSKQKSWLSGTIWKPKNPHSLEHLKFLYNVLCKNQTVTEQNRLLLVETLRSISEILIWGDQNDSSVFDFFLEKNMLSFFLRYLQQKFGQFICVQLLQTLNILFENISNETSLYYLLSNNHINSIIVHKFDFSDEEVMAYYISFLKTLSLKLNKHTIHFFYNENHQGRMADDKYPDTPKHTNDFALYTEAIKFFNHSETMVRIAVRTITLNVFKVDDNAMLCYIRDRTASPYFSNLVWFIGNHILDLDTCVRHDHDHRSRDRLSDLVAEHLDHMHYLNDIFLIDLDTLNGVLTDKLINRLLVPLYIFSLTKRKKFTDEPEDRKHVSGVVSLFLLSQMFLITNYPPLTQQMAEIIFEGDLAYTQLSSRPNGGRKSIREFRPPRESLEKTLDASRAKRPYDLLDDPGYRGQVDEPSMSSQAFQADVLSSPSTEGGRSPSSEMCPGDTELSSPTQNSTDEEKLMGRQGVEVAFTLDNRPYLEAVFNALECSENDYSALFGICLLWAIGKNEGVSQTLLDSVLMPSDKSLHKDNYNLMLVEKLIRIIELACQSGSKVRQCTLDMCIRLLKQLVNKEDRSYLQDRHLACIENARECCTQLLRNFYKSEEIFLDMFEDEYREMKTRPLNVEYLMQDASILLPPTGTPLTGIDFCKRLPCGEVERARRAIRVFFMVRDLSLALMHEPETQLPLTKPEACIKMEDVLDLNNSDLIACTVVNRESRRQERRFLVIDPVQLILVEPDSKRLGWGVVKFVGFLQDVEVSGDKDDSRLLHVVVHKPQSSVHAKPLPILSARFVFDDHIRCMAAKQRLIKGRQRARQQKMSTIERLLDIAQREERGHFTRSGPIPGRVHAVRTDSTKASRASPPGTSGGSSSPAGDSGTAAPGTPAGSSTPGKPVRKVTAEQKRLLQAKAAQKRMQREARGATPPSCTPPREGPRPDLGAVESATSAIELNDMTPPGPSSLGAGIEMLSLGGQQPAPITTQPPPTQQMTMESREGTITTSSQLDTSGEHLAEARSSVSRSTKPEGHAQREMSRFQRSHSHSPTRHGQDGTSSPKSLLSQRLSNSDLPQVNTSSVPMSQPHSHSSADQGGSHRRRFHSGPTSAASLRAADAPLISQVTPRAFGSGVHIPQLLPTTDGTQAGKDHSTNATVSYDGTAIAGFGVGAKPKVYAPAGQAPEFKVPLPTGVTGVSEGSGLTAQKLSLHGLQHNPQGSQRSRPDKAEGSKVEGGKGEGSAVSPETPSSVDSVTSVASVASSDASMVSLSSMASESSMDVDSDPGVASGGVKVGGPRRDGASGGASASLQLTQLAQMVQEHYPLDPYTKGAPHQGSSG